MITDKNKKIDLLYEEITYKVLGAAAAKDSAYLMIQLLCKSVCHRWWIN
jgi:hypothetical protein